MGRRLAAPQRHYSSGNCTGGAHQGPAVLCCSNVEVRIEHPYFGDAIHWQSVSLSGLTKGFW